MKDNHIRFSIITPSFNQGNFIEETIQSVLSQGFEAFEHIVIDGGSTDNTTEVLRKYTHLKWVSERDKGQSDAINKGLSLSRGDIVVWLNSDDTLCDGALKLADEAFDMLGCDMLSGKLKFINSHSQEIGSTNAISYKIDSLLNSDLSVNQPSTFIKRKVIFDAGCIDPTLHFAMDYDLILRILSRKCVVATIDSPLACFRFHSESKTNTYKYRFFSEIYQVRRKFKELCTVRGDIYVRYNILKNYLRYNLVKG